MMKKFAVIIAVLCVFLAVPCEFADYYDEGHQGTEANPYEIDTKEDLVSLRDRVNAGTEEAGKYYKLTHILLLEVLRGVLLPGHYTGQPIITILDVPAVF